MKTKFLFYIFLFVYTGSIAQNVLVQEGVRRIHSHIDTNYIYPEWWGANASDTASDRAAIQSAIESAYLKNKDVWLGCGSYKVSSFVYDATHGIKYGLRLRGNVRLVGHGYKSVIYSTVNSDSFNLIYVRDSSTENLIQDIHLRSDSCHLGAAIFISNACQNKTVTRVKISGGMCYGIKLIGASKVNINNCNIECTSITNLDVAACIKLNESSFCTVERNTLFSNIIEDTIKNK